MDQELALETERARDIPLLLAQMERMGLPALINRYFPTHGNWVGLDPGWVAAVWLASILSRGDHRLSHVQPWIAQHRYTLEQATGVEITDLDWADDRLSAVLRLLSQDEAWQALESALWRNLLRVYALEVATVRIDTTSASGYWSVTAGGLFQFGHSKDHRPDLPQLALSTLDPLGLPVATDVLAGNRADDPVYIPSVERVRKALKKKGLLYVGEAKMAALETRAFIAAGGDHYLCPLAQSQCSQAQLSAYLAADEAQSLTEIRDREAQSVAQAFEQFEVVTTEVDGETLTWTERRLVVRSLTQAEASEKRLDERLAKAEQGLARLNERGRGRKRHDDRASFEAQVEALLKRHKVEGLFTIGIKEQADHRVIRAYGDRPMRIQWRHRYSVVLALREEAVAARRARLGWRVYATNRQALTLEQAVWAYRNQYVLERSFGRLKGRPLSLRPMYLQRDDHATGLVRLMSLGLRVLILLEFVVRRQLAAEEASLAGLYAGNPKRATARPTSELLLEAFGNVTLTMVRLPGGRYFHLTPLTELQQRILCLSGFAAEVYTRLCRESAKPP